MVGTPSTLALATNVADQVTSQEIARMATKAIAIATRMLIAIVVVTMDTWQKNVRAMKRNATTVVNLVTSSVTAPMLRQGRMFATTATNQATYPVSAPTRGQPSATGATKPVIWPEIVLNRTTRAQQAIRATRRVILHETAPTKVNSW